ncbi:MAG: hypothetical protein HUU37_05415 [Bdellovibrionales bacterium]|nr:hypothetical protein [Bdellovibrionales bacterium]
MQQRRRSKLTINLIRKRSGRTRERVLFVALVFAFAALAARAEDQRRFVLPGGAAAMTGALVIHQGGAERFSDDLRQAVRAYDRAFIRWALSDETDENARRSLAREVRRREGVIAKIRQGQLHFNAAFTALEAAILAGTIYQSVIHDDEVQQKLEVRP